MNYSDGNEDGRTVDGTTVPSSTDYSRRELLLKVWFGLSVVLTAIGLGLTLWGTVYHPAGGGDLTAPSSSSSPVGRTQDSPRSSRGGRNIDTRAVLAGLLCLAFGALALGVFCWYTKCCNTNGLPECPANNGADGGGAYDDSDVPKHIPPPMPGLLITQTFGPVRPGTISNLTPPQIHKLASTPTDDRPPFSPNVPPIASMRSPRVSFSGPGGPCGPPPQRSPRGSFSGNLPHSRMTGPVHSLPGLGTAASNSSHSRPSSPVHTSPRHSASTGQACLLKRSVKPGTIANLTPPQIHQLATTPTDEPLAQFYLPSSKSKER